ncbi:hypothetical protein OWR28_02295 [Chryseobacterium sp. 1B4]
MGADLRAGCCNISIGSGRSFKRYHKEAYCFFISSFNDKRMEYLKKIKRDKNKKTSNNLEVFSEVPSVPNN